MDGRGDETDTMKFIKDRVMPPLVLIGAVAIGGAALVRWGLREARRINRELDEARFDPVREPARAEKTLRYDPERGSYRPG